MSDEMRRIRLGGSVVDLALGVAFGPDGSEVNLRPKTAALLRTLAARPGVVVSKDEIVAAVWKGSAVDDDGIVQCVGEIRRALGSGGREALRTHARRGYSLHPGPADEGAASSGFDGVRRPSAGRPRSRAVAVGVALAAASAVLLAMGFVEPASEAPSAGVASPFAGASVYGDGVALSVEPLEVETVDAALEAQAARLAREVAAAFAVTRLITVVEDGLIAAPPPAGAASDGLGSRFALRGVLRDDGDRLHAALRLLDTESGAQLWSKTFEGGSGDPDAAFRELSDAIAAAVFDENASMSRTRSASAAFSTGSSGAILSSVIVVSGSASRSGNPNL